MNRYLEESEPSQKGVRLGKTSQGQRRLISVLEDGQEQSVV